jgi:3-oxoadipate enol-lactonase
MKFARINGATLHYRHRPTAGRPTIVFVNSLGTDMRIWNEVERLFGDAYGFVLYDKRGHGLSELGDAPHKIETHAADLASLLDHLGVESAIVCGLSIGGVIAQCLHGMRPDLIEGLILCDTAAKIGTEEMWNGRIEATLSEGIASFAGGVMEKWFTPDFHKSRTEELAGYKTMLVRQSPTVTPRPAPPCVTRTTGPAQPRSLSRHSASSAIRTARRRPSWWRRSPARSPTGASR